jgi:hypothetical protein
MTVASFSARCGSDFCDALWVSRMVRRGGDGPGFHGPAGLMVVARCLMRAASGQAAAKARRMRDAVSITRAPSLMSRRRMVANSAFASACALGIASRNVSMRGRLRGCGAAVLQPAQLSENLSPSGRPHLQVSRGIQGLVPEPRPRERADDIFELWRCCTAVLIGNLRSEILVVQSAQNRHRQRETDSLDGTRDRRVLVQR